MKNKILIAFTATLLQAGISIAQQSVNNISQKADALITDAYNKGLFSGVVVITHNGVKVYSKESGFADWQAKRAIKMTTLFNIGSLNKKFTQEIIHQLAEEKKLSYDDHLSRYLDLYPAETGNKITIRQLLDMQAGLADFLQDPHYFEDMKLKDFSLTDLMGIIKNEPLLFEPGTSQSYSNSGYAVLGAVIEKITGKSYEENLTERIVKPLGLKNIFYKKAEIQNQMNRAYGTDIDFAGNKKKEDDIANSTPAGGIYTDADDLLKFTEVKLMPEISPAEKQGIPLFAGGSPNWNSAISYNNKNGFIVVVMANTGNDIAVKIARRLHSIINDEPYPPLELPFKITLYKTIIEKGYNYIKNNAENIAAQQRLPYDDHFLNDVAYEFLIGNKPDIAINLYKVNIGLFAGSIYTCDVLAQAYLKTGDKSNALKYFKMVLTADPANQRVKKSVADLEDGK